MTRKALGRGLEALIPRAAGEAAAAIGGEKATLPVDCIRPNPWQPRRSPDPLKMDELVRSIQARGVLEPVLVRPMGGKYELVAGERRLRAAQRIGMKDIPAIIVELTDKESLEVALIENLQREDLSPVDEARAYQILVEEFDRTHDQIAEQVAKDRSTVSNLIRLLKLPEIVLDALASGALTVGHARALLGLPRPQDQDRWGRRIVDEGWSVREAESRIAEATRPRPGTKEPPEHPIDRDPHLARVEEAIRRRVGTEVRLFVSKKGSGRLEFRYADQQDLERILDILGVQVH
jgi:ParB family transcriptional regulator, chromosome partitioning protein